MQLPTKITLLLKPIKHIVTIATNHVMITVGSTLLVAGTITATGMTISHHQSTQAKQPITISDNDKATTKPIKAGSPEAQKIIQNDNGTFTDGATTYTKTTTSSGQVNYLPVDKNQTVNQSSSDDAQKAACINAGGTWTPYQSQYTCDFVHESTDSTSSTSETPTNNTSAPEDLSYDWYSTFVSKPTYTDKTQHWLKDSNGNNLCDPNSTARLIEANRLWTTNLYPSDPYFYDTTHCYGYKLTSTTKTGDRYDSTTQQYVDVYKYAYSNYAYSPLYYTYQNQYIQCTETKKEINDSGNIRRTQVINHVLRDTVPSSVGYSGQDGCSFYQNNRSISKTVTVYGNPYTPITYDIRWRDS